MVFVLVRYIYIYVYLFIGDSKSYLSGLIWPRSEKM